jgi:hypothetical protein
VSDPATGAGGESWLTKSGAGLDSTLRDFAERFKHHRIVGRTRCRTLAAPGYILLGEVASVQPSTRLRKWTRCRCMRCGSTVIQMPIRWRNSATPRIGMPYWRAFSALPERLAGSAATSKSQPFLLTASTG